MCFNLRSSGSSELVVSIRVPVCSQSGLTRILFVLVLLLCNFRTQAEHNALKVEHAISFAKNNGFVAPGDLVVVTSGVISGNSGGTNTMSIETVPK